MIARVHGNRDYALMHWQVTLIDVGMANLGQRKT